MAKAKREVVQIDKPVEPALVRPPGLIFGHEVKTENIEWEWDGRILRGEVNMIDGVKNVGKSSLLAKIAATIANGDKFPGDRKAGKPGTCLWFTTEERFAKAVKRRFALNGGEENQIATFDVSSIDESERIILPGCVDRLIDTLRWMKARVFCLDPFDSLAHPNANLYDGNQARRYTESMMEACHATGATCICVRHPRKGTKGAAIEHGAGSMQVNNVARMVCRADFHPNDDGSRIFSTVTTNFGDPPKGYIYSIQGTLEKLGVIVWEKETPLTVSQIIEENEEAGEMDEKVDATTLLKNLLKDRDVEANIIDELGGKAMISKRALRYAKKKLGIRSKFLKGKKGDNSKWLWLRLT